MNQYNPIKLKAALLLTVFSLNTVIAFACAMGIKMGYNNQHHHEQNKVQKETAHAHGSHDHGTAHHESTTGAHHHDQQESTTDDCCTGNAIKFQSEDKQLQQLQNIAVKTPVYLPFLSSFYNIEAAAANGIAAVYKYLIPRYYPPPDIRIVIQSFQI